MRKSGQSDGATYVAGELECPVDDVGELPKLAHIDHVVRVVVLALENDKNLALECC